MVRKSSLRGAEGLIDRPDATWVLMTALEEGSLAGAGRRPGRSPPAVTRAVAFLDSHAGIQLQHRTSRKLRPTEAGKHCASVCQRLLVELAAAETAAAGDRTAHRGVLTITAPVVFWTHVSARSSVRS